MTELVIRIKQKDFVFLVASLFIIFSIGYAIAQTPNPGHSANQIGSGQFAVGDYVFPGTSRVGIGGAPSSSLHVMGSGAQEIYLQSTNNNAFFKFGNDIGTWTFGVHDTTGRAQLVEEGHGERITILKGGNVGIGTDAPATTLDIDGSLKINESHLINQIEHGIIGNCNLNNNAGSSGTVTFDSEFPAAPKVFLTPMQNSGCTSARVHSISSTGFSWGSHAANDWDQASSCDCIFWLAIG